MVIRLLAAGGLGNQLFQYAAVGAQAKRLGVEMEIDLLFYDPATPRPYSFWLAHLPIRARLVHYPQSGPLAAHGLARRAWRKLATPIFWRRYRQPAWTEDHRFFQIADGTIVSGYFQSLFYLLPRDEEVLAELSLWHAAPPEACEFARSIASANYVSLHIRRGDAVSHPEFGHLDSACYAGAAMDLLRNKLGRPRFLVFSDDIEWCKRSGVFSTDCEFIAPNRFGDNPAIDLLLMSLCSHHIVANSTYSWWAAWAQFRPDKICVIPRMWTASRTAESLGLVHPDWFTL